MQETERRLYHYGDLIRRIKDIEEEIMEHADRKVEMTASISRPMGLIMFVCKEACPPIQ